MRRARWVVALVLGTVTLGCAHSYTQPTLTTIQSNGQEVDVAWVIEDGRRIIRCVGAIADRPVCRRGIVD